jgi:hypothetical protein
VTGSFYFEAIKTSLINVTTLNVASNLSVSGAFTSNSVNTTFFYDTFTIPFINTLALSTTNILVGAKTIGSNLAVFSNTVIAANSWVGISNTSPSTALSVGGQITSLGNNFTSNYGTCPPLTYRQGGPTATQGWATPGTTNYSIIGGSLNMQSGTNAIGTAAAGAGTFTVAIGFPLSYTSNPAVQVTSYGITGNIYASLITNLGFTAVANAASVPFGWLAMGI